MAATMPGFSARQQALLAAMGYTLYGRRCGADQAMVSSGVSVAGEHGGAVHAEPGPSSAATEPELRHGALMRSVLRAAHRDPGTDTDLARDTWRELALPSPDSLLGAAGKRALWPQLRRLLRFGVAPR